MMLAVMTFVILMLAVMTFFILMLALMTFVILMLALMTFVILILALMTFVIHMLAVMTFVSVSPKYVLKKMKVKHLVTHSLSRAPMRLQRSFAILQKQKNSDRKIK